ncbi:MAG: RES family NAD+ phosphorylase [Acidobacteriota bacterium]|nr:RES family NAD+ phosphorylase [Acidobacteriota bacterium]
MAEFKSYRSYWDFSHSVSREWRYTRSSEQEEFLSAVLDTSDSREVIIPQDEILHRAQIGHDLHSVDIDGEPGEEPCPFPPERMKPLKNQASEGRANPKGIPYLYLATQLSTAISEVRPWVDALVSVAQLKVTRPLTIVDFSKEEKRLIAYLGEPNAPERERAVWRDINYAFSRPVTQNELVADYVPTQMLAELFREHSFDGIGYKSSLGSGSNLALFDFEAADVINCTLFHVDAVDFVFSERDRYFIKKHYP